LPTGLLLNSATGAITGTPSTPGTFNFTIRATDVNGCFASRPYSVAIPGITPAGGPTLSLVGLAILMVLLAGAGLFVMDKSWT
jgi:hypothetical protein